MDSTQQFYIDDRCEPNKSPGSAIGIDDNGNPVLLTKYVSSSNSRPTSSNFTNMSFVY